MNEILLREDSLKCLKTFINENNIEVTYKSNFSLTGNRHFTENDINQFLEIFFKSSYNYLYEVTDIEVKQISNILLEEIDEKVLIVTFRIWIPHNFKYKLN